MSTLVDVLLIVSPAILSANLSSRGLEYWPGQLAELSFFEVPLETSTAGRRSLMKSNS